MNISILCVFVISITILSVDAYDINNKCSHDRVTADYFNIHPEEKMEHLAIRKRMLDVAKDYVKSMSIHDRSKSIMEVTTVQIPVVWHVLYTPDIPSTFVTKDQIDQEMIWLNDWYSAQNVNFDTASSLWSSDIAQAEDFGIQFVLATRDPNGDSTDGIEYRETSVGDTCGDSEIFLSSEGGLDIWNPLEYMNLYTCNIPDLGYAYIPTASTHYRDGIVLNYDQLGDSFYSGSTISHEVGHWLGLEHTFGENDTCEDDDSIDDTPNTDSPVTSYAPYGTSCPGQNGTVDSDFVRCGNIVMVQNNMDYNYESCLAFFTKEQVAVMRAYLTEDTVRGGLSTSDGLNPNCGSYNCDDKTCGDDGCGGTCGDCSINDSLNECNVDQCIAPTVTRTPTSSITIGATPSRTPSKSISPSSNAISVSPSISISNTVIEESSNTSGTSETSFSSNSNSYSSFTSFTSNTSEESSMSSNGSNTNVIITLWTIVTVALIAF